jgi:anthranilate synthase component 1
MSAYTHLALTRELPGDLDTPVGTFLKLGNRPYSYLLESMHGGERWGRYSFIGLPAREVIRIKGHTVTVTVDGQVRDRIEAADPIAWLRAHAAQTRIAPDPKLPRFTGGFVGYFGYECVRLFEPKLGTPNPDPLGTPDVLLMRSDEVVVFDAIRATLTLVVHADLAVPGSREAAEARLDAIEAELGRPVPAPEQRRSAPDAPPPAFVSGFGEDAFKNAVLKIKDYIAAGDVMQVVPSQRMSAPYTAPPVALYRALRRLNPSPYLYCLNLDDHHIVGSSPEILVRVDRGEVTVRPIAGTRVRGKTVEEDAALEAELLADPKEIAEHLMLIDLGRNDVGRVATTGSVKLTEKMIVERYSHVMHIVSNVTGQLKPGLDALDALAATFPAGTLSGAPKVRAMEIIDEVEPVARGIYGGAVGYLGWDGNMDVAIAIRTAVIKDGRVHAQAGAGVVADSVPQSEWDETINKNRAVMRAVTDVLGVKR